MLHRRVEPVGTLQRTPDHLKKISSFSVCTRSIALNISEFVYIYIYIYIFIYACIRLKCKTNLNTVHNSHCTLKSKNFSTYGFAQQICKSFTPQSIFNNTIFFCSWIGLCIVGSGVFTYLNCVLKRISEFKAKVF